MRKVSKILIVFIIAIMFATTVKGATKQELIDYASKEHTIGGESFKLSSENIVKIERYLEENTISEADADKVIEKAEAVKKLMNDAGVSYPGDLSSANKEKAMQLANEAAELLKVTLNFDMKNNVIEIYKDGKKIDVVSFEGNNKLAYTGNNSYIYILPATVAVVALATVALRKKVG